MSKGLRRPTWILATVNLCYALALVVGAVVPSPHVDVPGLTVSDTWLHAVAYGVQALLLLWLLSSCLGRIGAAVGAWAGAFVIGAGTELLQMLQPARAAELRDLLADAVGAAMGVLVGLISTWLVRRGEE